MLGFSFCVFHLEFKKQTALDLDPISSSGTLSGRVLGPQSNSRRRRCMFQACGRSWRTMCSAPELCSRGELRIQILMVLLILRGSLKALLPGAFVPGQQTIQGDAPSYRRVTCRHTFKGCSRPRKLRKGNKSFLNFTKLLKQMPSPQEGKQSSLPVLHSAPRVCARCTGLVVTNVTRLLGTGSREAGGLTENLVTVGQLWEMPQRKGEDTRGFSEGKDWTLRPGSGRIEPAP